MGKRFFDAAAAYRCRCKDRWSLQPASLPASPLFEQKGEENLSKTEAFPSLRQHLHLLPPSPAPGSSQFAIISPKLSDNLNYLVFFHPKRCSVLLAAPLLFLDLFGVLIRTLKSKRKGKKSSASRGTMGLPPELSCLGKPPPWRSPRHRLQAGAAGRELGSKGWEGRRSVGRELGRQGRGSARRGREGWDISAKDRAQRFSVCHFLFVLGLFFPSPPLFSNILPDGFSSADSQHVADPPALLGPTAAHTPLFPRSSLSALSPSLGWGAYSLQPNAHGFPFLMVEGDKTSLFGVALCALCAGINHLPRCRAAQIPLQGVRIKPSVV